MWIRSGLLPRRLRGHCPRSCAPDCRRFAARSEALVSVEEYLSTVYEPDCDYVDGELVERNVGEYEHSRLQWALGQWFGSLESSQGVRVIPELRVQVAPT